MSTFFTCNRLKANHRGQPTRFYIVQPSFVFQSPFRSTILGKDILPTKKPVIGPPFSLPAESQQWVTIIYNVFQYRPYICMKRNETTPNKTITSISHLVDPA
jgi:hypothetical protein